MHITAGGSGERVNGALSCVHGNKRDVRFGGKEKWRVEHLVSQSQTLSGESLTTRD